MIKRFALILIALCLVMGLVACSTSPTPTSTAQPSTPTSSPTSMAVATPEPATPGPAEQQDPTQSGSLRVHFIDVGQGDSILIVAPDGKAALIDGGEAKSGALEYLRSQGIEQLDLVVATHPHADHIGGLIEILETIPVAEVVTNGQPHTTRTYENFLDAIVSAKATYTEVQRGDNLQLGALTLHVLHPTSETEDDINNQSVVLRLAHGNVSFLFAGDAEHEAEASILGSGSPVEATVLKVGHHGSRTASSEAFLAAVRPEVAVYSAEKSNSYGHPHQQTLDALAAVGAEVYGTDVNGTVVVVSDGSSYDIEVSKEGEPRAPPSAQAPVGQLQAALAGE